MVQELKPVIYDILKGSDMTTVSAKSVRKQLETLQGCSYNDKKKEVDALIMEVYQSLEGDNDSSSEEEPLSTQKSSSSQLTGKDAEYEAYVMKPSPSKRKSTSKGKAGDKDEKAAKKRKTRNSSSTGRGAPNNGFMKPLKLSPAIQVLTRSDNDELPRPQIVKRIWEYIKENDLQDPKDRRSILCDDTMKAVFKTERVHMFTMNKILNEELKAVADDQAS